MLMLGALFELRAPNLSSAKLLFVRRAACELCRYIIVLDAESPLWFGEIPFWRIG